MHLSLFVRCKSRLILDPFHKRKARMLPASCQKKKRKYRTWAFGKRGAPSAHRSSARRKRRTASPAPPSNPSCWKSPISTRNCGPAPISSSDIPRYSPGTPAADARLTAPDAPCRSRFSGQTTPALPFPPTPGARPRVSTPVARILETSSPPPMKNYCNSSGQLLPLGLPLFPRPKVLTC